MSERGRTRPGKEPEGSQEPSVFQRIENEFLADATYGSPELLVVTDEATLLMANSSRQQFENRLKDVVDHFAREVQPSYITSLQLNVTEYIMQAQLAEQLIRTRSQTIPGYRSSRIRFVDTYGAAMMAEKDAAYAPLMHPDVRIQQQLEATASVAEELTAITARVFDRIDGTPTQE